MFKYSPQLLFSLLFSLLIPAEVILAQESANPKPTTQAIRITDGNQINLDGDLTESTWQQAPVATGFIQQAPNDGAPATEETKIQMAYSDDALYVAVTAYESNIDSAAATLFRKDGSAYTDWVSINIDSYNDNRTSFDFGVNPRGVRQDVLIYNNGNQDSSWDAVWEAQTTLNENAWTAEVRIPFSQLRFDSKADQQTWGINFQRWIARKEEMAYWSPTPQDVSGVVSQYGTLTGIKNLPDVNRLEIKPYVSGSLTRAPGNSENPYYDQNEWDASIGGDIKYGISSDFTLTGTINPDFGQVEADPAVINLSAFETFYPEQRPFFLEGTDIFEFGSTETNNTYGIPQTFYSRRIGRQPQGQVPNARPNAQYIDRPDQTNIAGAAKVSGKTDDGFSLGILNAFTLREKAQYQTTGGQDGSVSVEPPTNYFVGRVKQDYDDGNTIVGGYLSATNRMIDTNYLKESLHSSSYVGGVDFEHGWNNRDWVVSGVVTGSTVQGTAEAITQTQTNSTHYYNRVDADYLSVDNDRKQLNGYAGELSVSKSGGEHWLGSLTYATTSPGYEVNDIGYQRRADYHTMYSSLIYQENSPDINFLRNYNIGFFAGQGWNHGGDRFNNYANIGWNINFSNLWSLNTNINYMGQEYDDRITRGGPVVLKPRGWNTSSVLMGNPSNMVSWDGGFYIRRDQEGGRRYNVQGGISIRPASNIQISVRPQYDYRVNTDQYVTTVSDPLANQTYDHRYIFASIERRTFSTTFRLDWTFTTSMSLQTYLRPFISSGDYYNYKELRAPRSMNYTVYGTDGGSIQKEENSYIVDPDGAGPADSFSFQEQDFNTKVLQTNAVFRWEYQPGSILYLVWQQDRSAFTRQNNLRLGRDTERLFDTEPTNVLMVKFSYWFGS